MATTKIVRTTTATIRVRFYDVAGLPAVPSSATIKLKYRDLTGDSILVEDDMTLDAGQYKYLWDSTPAAPGSVSGHIHSVGGDPVGVDFTFEVTANPANLA